MKIVDNNLNSYLFNKLSINLSEVPLEKLADYTAIKYYLTVEDEPPSNVDNLNRINRYIQTLHHLCHLKRWIPIKLLLNTPLDVSSSTFDLSLSLPEYLFLHGLSKNLLESIEEIIVSLKNIEYEKTFLLILKARALSDISEKVSQSHKLFEKIRLKTHKSSEEYIEATTYLGISQINFSGIYQVGISNIQESLQMIDILLKEHQELNSSLKWQDMRADIIENLALYEMNSSRFHIAMRLYTDAIHIRQEYKIFHKMIIPLVHKGVLLRRLKKYKQAIQSLTKAIAVANDIKSNNNIAWAEHHLAYVYINQGNYREAEKFCKKSLRVYQKMEDLRGISDSYEQLGFINLAKNNFDDAEINFQNALNQRKAIGNFHGTASSILDLALVSWHQKQYFKSILLLLSGFRLYYKLNVLNTIRFIRMLRLAYTWTLGKKKWTM
jgi:tetratricopeptide (TPR) repeat protein